MVYRPGQPARPQYIPEQYHVYITLPPMRSIANEKVKMDLSLKHGAQAISDIQALIQNEGPGCKTELSTHALAFGFLVLTKCPDDLAEKVKAVTGVKSVDPAPAYYPAKRPGPNLRGGPQ